LSWYTPKDFSSYTFVLRIEIAIGNTEMYIITMYRTGMAGCKPESETLEKPAVRVEADWNRPFTMRVPVGRLETTAALI
jgi:hypothetical protein